MGLLRLLIGGAREKHRENKAKHEMEERLGRKVDKSELYSLGAQLEAAPVEAGGRVASPPRPRARLSAKTKLVLLGGAAALVLAAAALFTWESLPERTRNGLNPFAPKVPRGAFPDTVAGFHKDSEIYYEDWRASGSGYRFAAYYKSPDGKTTVHYTVIDFGSPEQAKKDVHGRSYLGGGGRVVQQEEGRAVASDPYNGGAIISDAFGQRVVRVSSRRPEDAVAFENGLPYATFGVSQPPPHTAAGVEEVIPALSLLNEFQRDKAAAAAKYDGKTFLFTGAVAGVSKSQQGQPMIALQKEGEKPGLGSTVACAFQPSEEAKVAALKKGQEARFRCRVSYIDAVGLFTLEDCTLE